MNKNDDSVGSAVVPGERRGSPDVAAATDDLLSVPNSGGEITLRRLRIFWAVAHSATLTQAAKLLNVSQPTLSQQLNGFEMAIGAALFDRRSNRMVLTSTGEVLLRKAESVLRSAQAMEDFLPNLGGAARQTLRLAGVASVMRVILPAAMAQLVKEAPSVEFDIHEKAPAEILDLLYGRRVNMGLMDANSVAEVSAGFQQIPIMNDPFVLAVPEGMDLSRVADPDKDLEPGRLELCRSVRVRHPAFQPGSGLVRHSTAKKPFGCKGSQFRTGAGPRRRGPGRQCRARPDHPRRWRHPQGHPPLCRRSGTTQDCCDGAVPIPADRAL